MSRVPDPLRLQQISATEEIEQDHQITYLASIVDPKPERRCCLLSDYVGFGRSKQAFRDQPLRRKYVDIWIRRPRYRCKHCGAIVLAKVPGMESGHRMTKRLADDVFKASFKRTFADVGREVGLTDKSIANVFNGRIDAALASHAWETPRVLGIDEKKLMGDFRCVLGDVEQKCLVELLSNRRKRFLLDYVSTMRDRERVEIVCMDMWPTYRDLAIDHFPKAKIVTDKFHVVRMANDAMEVIRKEIRKTLPKERRVRLMHERFTLLKRRRSWKDKDLDRVEQWHNEFPELVQIYDVKEGFYEIFEQAASQREAHKLYFAWHRTIPDKYRSLFKPITTAMGNWGDSAFTCCEPGFQFTNAYVETLNGLIGQLNQAGRGYSFDVLRGKALMAYGRHREAERKFKRIKPDDLIEMGGEIIRRDSIIFYRPDELWTPPPRETGVPISTLAALIADGALDAGSPLFYE